MIIDEFKRQSVAMELSERLKVVVEEEEDRSSSKHVLNLEEIIQQSDELA